MKLEVRFDKTLVYGSTIPLCPASRSSANSQGQEGRIHFSFRPQRAIKWQGDEVTFTSKAGAVIEADVWEAGAEEDSLLLGVGFNGAKQVYVNSIHLAKPGSREESEFNKGLTVVTYPVDRQKK